MELTDIAKIVGGAVLIAIATLASTLLVLRSKKREARNGRRKEVREALVKYANIVRRIDGGVYPLRPNTHEGWSPVYEEVETQRLEVARVMDLDRATAGRRWCEKVDKCLAIGRGLVHKHHGIARGLVRAADVETALMNLREAFKKAYEKAL